MILFHFIDQMFKNIISRVISKKKKYLAVVLIRFISLFLSVFATHTLTRCGCDCIYIGSDKKHTRNLENAELTTSPQQHSPIAEWRQNILAAGSVFFIFFFYLHWSEMPLLGSASNATFRGQSMRALLSTAIIKMHVSLEEFCYHQPESLQSGFFFYFAASFCFGCAPHKADYVLAVLQTTAAKK